MRNFLFYCLLIFSVLIYKVYTPTTFTISSKASTQSPSLSSRLTAKAMLKDHPSHTPTPSYVHPLILFLVP